MSNEYKKNRIEGLDHIRGLTALYVVIGHARFLCWEGYSDGFLLHPETYSQVDKLLVYFFSAFKFGHEAVYLFFLLSGYVMYVNYSDKIKGIQTAKMFVFKRFYRVWPPFMFSIIIALIFDGIRFLSKSPFNPNDFQSFPTIFQSLDDVGFKLVDLIGTIFFVAPYFTKIFSSNVVIWSLTLEWWFYILFALFFLLFKLNIKNITIALFAFLYSFILFPKLLEYFHFHFITGVTIWFFGAVLAKSSNTVYKLEYSNPLLFLLVLASPIYILKSLNYNENQLIINNIFTNITTFIIVTILMVLYLRYYNKISVYLRGKLSYLGKISYSLYILHFPFLLLIASVWIKYFKVLPKNYYAIIVFTSLSVILAAVLYPYIEKPFLKTKIKSVKNNV